MYHLRVPQTEEELERYYQFRWEMLRKPLHQPKGSERDAWDAMAHHQMVGAVGGTWNVSGNQVSATASAMGQNISIVAEIKGNNLWYQGRALKRIH